MDENYGEKEIANFKHRKIASDNRSWTHGGTQGVDSIKFAFMFTINAKVSFI